MIWVLTPGTHSAIIPAYKDLIMDYKPYSIEWTRKRYLTEAIYKYFEDGVDSQVIADEISDILEDAAIDYTVRAQKLRAVKNKIKQ